MVSKVERERDFSAVSPFPRTEWSSFQELEVCGHVSTVHTPTTSICVCVCVRNRAGNVNDRHTSRTELSLAELIMPDEVQLPSSPVFL